MRKQPKREREQARRKAAARRQAEREQRARAMLRKRSDGARRERMRELDDASPIRPSRTDIAVATVADMKREIEAHK